MSDVAKPRQDFLPTAGSHNWEAIERSLEIATKAESLRERSRKLREASRLIRGESARISREAQQHLYNPLAMVFRY